MMNKSKIDWCDFTWNPVTGCTRGCEYCYAAKQARRFCGDVRLNLTSPQIVDAGGRAYILEQPFKSDRETTIPFPVGFRPTFHRYRLSMPAEKHKAGTIFVCSMGDLFNRDIPTRWIIEVFDACLAAPQHHYLFLTKFPERYQELEHLALLPHGYNFWYGTTVTRNHELGRISHLPLSAHRFVSIEPILENIGLDLGPVLNPAGPAAVVPPVEWVIVGAETGNQKSKKVPRREWLTTILDEAHENHIPVLMKNSKEMRSVWENAIPQAFPTGLEPMPQDNSIPHCKECELREETHQGRRGTAIACQIGWEADGYHDRPARPVPGRYTRSSPPWCPRRGEKE